MLNDNNDNKRDKQNPPDSLHSFRQKTNKQKKKNKTRYYAKSNKQTPQVNNNSEKD